MATVQARVDDRLKMESEMMFKSMGLTISGAINIFLQQVVNQRKLPFEVVAAEVPNAETIQAMEDTLEQRNLHGPYSSVKAMMEALDA